MPDSCPSGSLSLRNNMECLTGWVPCASHTGMELLAQCVKQPKTMKGIGPLSFHGFAACEMHVVVGFLEGAKEPVAWTR